MSICGLQIFIFTNRIRTIENLPGNGGQEEGTGSTKELLRAGDETRDAEQAQDPGLLDHVVNRA